MERKNSTVCRVRDLLLISGHMWQVKEWKDKIATKKEQEWPYSCQTK